MHFACYRSLFIAGTCLLLSQLRT
ncbi:hypothetical protein CGRA01v4_13143 [Colletotrichum graminicola]|nr:hypothetical protein CGRA01v4_13143 [Colletotrichum graminicola]